MHLFKRKNLLVYYTFFHIVGYYTWIYFWNHNNSIKILGGNIFSILAPLVTAVTLFFIYRNMLGKDKYFWLFCSLGSFSYLIAESIWSYYENILKVEVPFPGWPDLFYMLQIIFYLIAFLHKIWYKRDNLHLIKFIFDTCIIMTVAISFSWNFIIKDILAQEHVSNLYLFVTIGYPMGDLILLLGAISFYLGSEYFFTPKVLYLIFVSLVIQIFVDSAYLYLTAKDVYASGGVYDPLWSLALLLMGISGKCAINTYDEKETEQTTNRNNTYFIKNFFSLRLLLPYISVIFLFMVMVFQRKEINSLIIGSAVAIILVILRQIFTLVENQTLIKNYHGLTEELEQKIEVRTEEISKKNHQLLLAVQKMKHMAYHDVLSGLPNRRLFLEQLTTAMADAKRHSYNLAIIFIDLDRFKNINDTLGHDFGDLLLKFVSKEMSTSLRDIDTISRQGGDEFTILLNRISDESEVISLIKQMQSIVAKPILIKGQELHVSMSIGVAFYTKDGISAEELLKHADMAMYRAKEAGGNNFKFFSTEMTETISRKMTLENGLRKALITNEFVLHYQPQVDLETGKIIGMESLIRWNTTDSGMISPGEFIPLAEETGLIIPIGEWVLYTACKQAKIWHDSGYSHLKLAVNLSPLQFLHENLVNVVSNVLERTQFTPQSLEIEITEGVSVSDAEEAIIKMQAIRDLGVRISIDDFGTGYSSLIYLKRFPINSLKIAQPFIEDILGNDSDKALVKAIISMAHSLRLSVIAEGVETREQLQTLMELHCDEVQGYIYSKPLTAGEFSEILKTELSTYMAPVIPMI
jgi:diguanylate cyclase